MAGYIGSKAVITSGVSASIDELNIIDGVTATTAELNILDGVTSTAAELNILDGVTSTAAELNILDGVTATATELNLIDGVTATTAELNILDGVTATAAEINLIDGGTARGTTAIVDADGVLINDAGTMRMTSAATLATYIGTKITGGSMVYLASSGVIDDAANALIKSINYSGKNNKINIGTGETVEIKLLAKKIKKIMNFDGHIEWDKTAESGIHKKNFNIDCSKKDLNFNVKTSLEEGLKKTIGWYYEKN